MVYLQSWSHFRIPGSVFCIITPALMSVTVEALPDITFHPLNPVFCTVLRLL